MKFYYLLIFVVYVSSVSKKDGKKVFYRQDYTFLEEFDAFYKYHSVILNFSDAASKCSAEGGSMFRPLSLVESTKVLERFVPEEVPRIWIGAHDLYSEGEFITLDGQPLEQTYFNWAPGEPNDNFNHEDCVVLFRDATFNDGTCFTKEAYVCKRELSTLTQNVICETYDTGYEYSIELDKCYKAHTNPAKWAEAYRICKGEESSLTIINSEAEANYLIEQMARYPEYKYPGNFDKINFHLGFNDLIQHGVFVTTDGKTLTQAGYDKWSGGQPDQTGGDEHCGGMFRDGRLNDLPCGNRAMFFCEKDLSSSGLPTFADQMPNEEKKPYTPLSNNDRIFYEQPTTIKSSDSKQSSDSKKPNCNDFHKPGALVELPDV